MSRSQFSRGIGRFFATAILLSMILSFPVIASTPTNQANQSTHDSLPPGVFPQGYPGTKNIVSWGEVVVPIITASDQFKAISHGLTYHTDPYSSFGYSWGPSSGPTETVVLYSTISGVYIVAEIDPVTQVIGTMYFENDSKTGYIMDNGNPSANWGGYWSEYCNNVFFGCYGVDYLSGAYARAYIAQTTSPTGQTLACCALSEWSGVSTSPDGSGLTQGGVLWAGYNLPPPAGANGNGWILFTEILPAGPTYFTPPSWLPLPTPGDYTLTMETLISGTCSNPPGGGTGDLWVQLWWYNGNALTQTLGCENNPWYHYGDFILESPVTKGAGSACSNGGYPVTGGYACQLPHFYVFSNPQNDAFVDFFASICAHSNGNCRNINSNYDPLQAEYIVHRSTDTSTGPIPGNGGSWQESWLSSN
jgi:hypothetical protein